MSGTLLDSDVIIEVLRQRKPDLIGHWIDLVNAGEPLFYSPVSLAEIRQGMRDRERDSIERVFTGMTCLAVDDEVGRLAGDYLRAFRASHALALGDALIAATASAHGLLLWTQNRKHFPMKDLRFH